MDDPSTGTTEGFGLMFYNARMYDPALGRFTSADSIVPAGVQGYDRYAYVNNNPMKYIDPTGHIATDDNNNGRGGIYCYPGEVVCALVKSGYSDDEKNINHGKEDTRDKDSPRTFYDGDIEMDVLNCEYNEDCRNAVMGDYYSALGHPLDILVQNPPYHNPLGPNQLSFVEPSIIMQWNDGANSRFLDLLGLDAGHYYNYESTYLDALSNEYPTEYQLAVDQSNVFSEAAGPMVEFYVNPAAESGWLQLAEEMMTWETILSAKWPISVGDK